MRMYVSSRNKSIPMTYIDNDVDICTYNANANANAQHIKRIPKIDVCMQIRQQYQAWWYSSRQNDHLALIQTFTLTIQSLAHKILRRSTKYVFFCVFEKVPSQFYNIHDKESNAPAPLRAYADE